MKTYNSLEEITRLIEGFENGSWPAAEWTHQAHLTMGVWYLSKHCVPDATKLIRDGIKKYNVASGGQNTETRGYHETITLFYIWYIKKYLTSVSPDRSLVELTNHFLEFHDDKNLPFEFYGNDLLMSAEARRDWVEPDLKSLS